VIGRTHSGVANAHLQILSFVLRNLIRTVIGDFWSLFSPPRSCSSERLPFENRGMLALAGVQIVHTGGDVCWCNVGVSPAERPEQTSGNVWGMRSSYFFRLCRHIALATVAGEGLVGGAKGSLEMLLLIYLR
jgi:hypothetical protein